MSGITDKEAIESHVPIHNPDVDEQKVESLSPNTLIPSTLPKFIQKL